MTNLRLLQEITGDKYAFWPAITHCYSSSFAPAAVLLGGFPGRITFAKFPILLHSYW